MIIDLTTKIVRKIFVGSKQNFVFTKRENIEVPALKKVDLYIHIPFCKNMCPYCPYNRIAYDKKLIGPYLKAVLNEINLYYLKLGRVEITSIYIGGGTPTNLIDELGIILNTLREKFLISGDICIETSPSDLNLEVLRKLKAFGVDLVSIGVQSFNDKCLKVLGRRYDSQQAMDAVKLTLSLNLKLVNIDLMFVLPGQDEKNVLADLKQAMKLGVNQITTYPLFTFPYTSIGKHLRINKIRMPNIFKRRKMYKKIYNFCIQNDYHQVSVWGFKKGHAPGYSSVTREHYIGIGAGACSRLPEVIYFNTFSVKDYINTALTSKSPVALVMNVTSQLEKYFWLYWKFYETRIDKDELENLFGKKDMKIKFIFSILKLMGLCKERKSIIELTERGSFYVHLLQNYFVLNYINNVWTVAMKKAWPKKIEI